MSISRDDIIKLIAGTSGVIDLGGADLSHTDLSNLDLARVSFRNADLHGVNFSHSNFGDLMPREPKLYMRFDGANCDGANFSNITGKGKEMIRTLVRKESRDSAIFTDKKTAFEQKRREFEDQGGMAGYIERTDQAIADNAQRSRLASLEQMKSPVQQENEARSAEKNRQHDAMLRRLTTPRVPKRTISDKALIKSAMKAAADNGPMSHIQREF